MTWDYSNVCSSSGCYLSSPTHYGPIGQFMSGPNYYPNQIVSQGDTVNYFFSSFYINPEFSFNDGDIISLEENYDMDFGGSAYTAYMRWTVNITTSETVVPEPISAILFVAGGTLLAGRRYIKRKK